MELMPVGGDESPPRFSVPRYAAIQVRVVRSTGPVGGARSPLSFGEMTLSDFLLFSAAASTVAVVVHWLARRYWLAVFMSASIASLLNIVHEWYTKELTIRPSDLALWIPMLFVEGILIASPAVVLVGVPFYVSRRSRQTRAV